MSKRIAVIIPCYNHARYVGEALESVLAQTRPADRIIVIDDGSKDDSVTVLQSFASRGVEVHSRENRGAHETLNELVGLAATDCDFIQILNSDDRFLPGRLQHCLDLAQQQPGKAVFTTGLRVIDGEGAVMPEDAPRSRWFHGAWSLGSDESVTLSSWLGQANFIATTTNVFATAAFLKENPFRPYRFNHDYFFLSTAVLENRLTVSRDVHVEYRVHGSNTIATKPEPLVREMIRLHLDLYRKHADALSRQPDMRKRFYEFTQASWDSISSLHAGLLQVALAKVVASASEDELETLAASLSGPEFEVFPNKNLAGAFDGKSSLAAGAALSRRMETMKEEMATLKKEKDALDKLSRCRQKLLRSRWVRLGLLTGFASGLVRNKGKTSHEKILSLRNTCQGSKWLKLGEQFGSKTAADLRRGEF